MLTELSWQNYAASVSVLAAVPGNLNKMQIQHSVKFILFFLWWTNGKILTYVPTYWTDQQLTILYAFILKVKPNGHRNYGPTSCSGTHSYLMWLLKD